VVHPSFCDPEKAVSGDRYEPQQADLYPHNALPQHNEKITNFNKVNRTGVSGCSRIFTIALPDLLLINISPPNGKKWRL